MLAYRGVFFCTVFDSAALYGAAVNCSVKELKDVHKHTAIVKISHKTWGISTIIEQLL